MMQWGRACVALLSGLLALWLGLPSARAQTVVLVPKPGVPQTDVAQLSAEQTLAEALSMQGMAVVDDTVVRRVLAAREPCDTDQCALKLMAAVGADLRAAIVVWRDEQGLPAKIHVTLADAQGHSYEGDANLQHGDVRSATTVALLDARAFQLLGPGPWLRVLGTPDAAQVYLDGELVGALPYRATIRSGRYRLAVRAPGYTGSEQQIDVPAVGDRKLVITVSLAPPPIESPVVGDPTHPASALSAGASLSSPTRPIVGPVVLGGVGGALILGDLILAAMVHDGSCYQRAADGACATRTELNVPSTLVWGGLGVAALGGGVLWYWLGAPETTPAVALRFGPGSLWLRGGF